MSDIETIKRVDNSVVRDYHYDNMNTISIDEICFNDYYDMNKFPGNTFGGDQNSLINNYDKYKEDVNFQKIVKKYYPNMSEKILKGDLKLFQLYGCGYVGLVNTLFLKYGDNIEFISDILGIDKECFVNNDKTIDYTKAYDYMVLDFMLYTQKDHFNYLLPDIKIPFENTSTTISYNKYLNEKNINNTCSNISSDINNIKKNSNSEKKASEICKYIDNLLNNGQKVCVNKTGGGKLYKEDSNGSMIDAGILPGGHCMSIIGTKDDKLIVSSWGKKYYLDPLGYMNMADTYTSVKYEDD